MKQARRKATDHQFDRMGELELRIDIPMEANKVRVVDIGNSRLRAMLGPIDVPHRLHAGRTADSVFVEFEYAMAAQELRETVVRKDVKFQVGVHSRRVFRLEFHSDAPCEVTFATKGLKLMEDEAQRSEVLVSRTRRVSHLKLVEDLLPWIQEKMSEKSRAEVGAY